MVRNRLQRRIGKLALAGIFIAIVGIPPLITLLTTQKIVAVSEKRYLANVPDLDFTLASISTFPKRFEGYFGDHFGLRDSLIHAYNYLSVVWLSHSTVPVVLLGTNGWLYPADHYAQEDFNGKYVVPPQVLNFWQHILQTRAAWFKAKGARYYFVITPNKQSVYPENLPAHLRKAGNTSQRELLARHMSLHSDVPVIDLTPALVKAKSVAPVYFRTGTHWTGYGAYAGARQIRNVIAGDYPKKIFSPPKQLRFSTQPYAGDLAYMLHLRGAFTETVSNITEVEPCAKQVDNAKYQPYAPKRQTVRVYRCPSAPLKVLVLHDSFGSLLEQPLAEYFGETVFNGINSLAALEPLIDRVAPDIVIDERNARFLSDYLISESAIEQAVYEPVIASDSKIYSLGRRPVTDAFSRTHKLVSRWRDNGLNIRSVGDATWMDIRTGGHGPLLIRMKMYAPTPAKLRLDSPVDSVTDPVPGHGITFAYNGWQTFYLELDNSVSNGTFRLHPSLWPGYVILSDLDVYQLPAKIADEKKP